MPPSLSPAPGNQSYAQCACALSLSSYNLFFLYFLGRIVFYVTSAQCCGVLQKVTRRRRICEWTPWCVPAHRSEGGGTSPDASRGPAPLPLPVTIPASRWMGASEISALSPLQGSHQILLLPVPFKTWKRDSPFDDPAWFIFLFFWLLSILYRKNINARPINGEKNLENSCTCAPLFSQRTIDSPKSVRITQTDLGDKWTNFCVFLSKVNF